MTQQLELDLGHVNSLQFQPSQLARRGATAYTGGGWKNAGPDDQTQVDPVRGHAMYLAYRDQLRAGPGAEPAGLRESYESLRQHVNIQHEHMTKPVEQGGMGLRHEVTPDDPYAHGGEMAADVEQGRIKTFSAKSTGEHEFFSHEETDRFRAVHDVFGHATTGRGFSRHGEEAAYRAHRQMFPLSAHPALASELRGQNSYLNYGPGGFAEQKGQLVGLPRWAETDEPPPATAQSRVRPYGKRRLF